MYFINLLNNFSLKVNLYLITNKINNIFLQEIAGAQIMPKLFHKTEI